MAIVEVDTLQRVRDMTEVFDSAGTPVTTQFRPSRIEAVTIADSSYLLMTSENAGFGLAVIEPTGGLAFVESFGGQFNPLEGAQFGNFGLTSFETNGKMHLYLTGANTDLFSNPDNLGALGVSTVRISADGDVNLLRGVAEPRLDGFGIGVNANFNEDPKIVTIGNTDMLVVSVDSRGGGEPGFQTYRIRDNGTLTFLRESQTATSDNDDFTIVQVGNKTYVVAASPFGASPAQVLKVGSKGSMAPVFELPQSDRAIFNQNIIDIHGVEIGGRAFVYMANNTGGNILGYEVLSDGRMTLVSNTFGGIGDDWRFPANLVSFEQDGRFYLAAGSTSLGVFEISDGGALTEVDEIPETFRSRIVGAQDLDAHDIGGQQYLFASTGSLDEVRSYRFIPEDDRLIFGGGNNNKRGSEADDQIFGRGGNDTLRADMGDDMVEGGGGNDRIFGQDGRDSLFGNDGDDALFGGNEDDFVFGGAGKDEVRGGAGSDVLYGGIGKDKVFGESGNDVLHGGVGNDQLRGGTGLDRLIDGNGSDRLFGESGADVFELERDGKLDVIRDYEDNSDTIDLTRWGKGLEFSDLVIMQDGNDVRLTWENEVLEIRAADGQIFAFELSLGDFVFA